MDPGKIDSIRDLLADHLESALKGDDVQVSDSVLRSAATFLRLYDPKHKTAKGSIEQQIQTVHAAASKVGGAVDTPPFSDLDQEIESS